MYDNIFELLKENPRVISGRISGRFLNLCEKTKKYFKKWLVKIPKKKVELLLEECWKKHWMKTDYIPGAIPSQNSKEVRDSK